MSFADDLNRYGPDQRVDVTLEDARHYCARLAAEHYENFSVVSFLTPPELRQDLEAIYGFCRWADDLGDEVGDSGRSLELLGWWRDQMRLCLRGDTRHPVMVALRPTIERHSIPIAPFEALISAFEQDQTVTRSKSYEQLLDYCTRSANPVGHLVLYVCGNFSAENAQLSDATCTALQLANFWQDVARDYVIGRIYLPEEDRVRFGVTEDVLRDREATEGFRALLRYEVARTRELLAKGKPLAGRLRGRVALAVDLFHRGGSAILAAIEHRDYDVLTRRPVVSRGRKVGIAGQALLGAFTRRFSGQGRVIVEPMDRDEVLDRARRFASAGGRPR